VKEPPEHRAEPEFAVLICLIEWDGEECVVLTKRPEALARYSGQVSLPGGRRDPCDLDLSRTALREMEEEVGIPSGRIFLTLEMHPHETSLGHWVKPYVGRVTGPCIVLAAPSEVERVLYLPSARLTPAFFRVDDRRVESNPVRREAWAFALEGFEVWGLTARILRDYALGRVFPLGGTAPPFTPPRASSASTPRAPRGEPSPGHRSGDP
jgi:8-oxo-dGTP pyrophosphatase MutT (NUDIX family)